MRILQLCKKFPYPLNDGESIAVSSLSKALTQLDCEVTLLCMNTSKHYFNVAKLPSSYNHYKDIQTVAIDNSVKPSGALLNLLSKDSYHISRFVSNDFKAALARLLEEQTYDVVILETLYLSPYVGLIRSNSDALVCYRSHNIESEIWTRIGKNTKNSAKRWYLKYLSSKLRNYELQHLNDYDLMATVTQRDYEEFKQLGYTKPGLASPIGIDINDYPLAPLQELNELSFIGSLDWMPNVEGLLWFVHDIFPSINAHFPKLKLHIAGRNEPKEITALNSALIKVHGEVASAINFIGSYKLMIVPLLSGSGMRVKILEGLALGRIIITTSIGLEGIPAKDGEHLFIADNANEFLASLDKIIGNPSLMVQMSKAARSFVETNYDALSNAEILLNKIKLQLNEKAGN